MILSHCFWEINETTIRVLDTTTLQSYTDAGVDRTSFTNVKFKIYRVNDSENYLEQDITDNLAYLYDCGGLTLTFESFGESTFNEYAYWPDALYTSVITYTYNGTEYTSTHTAGFKKIIEGIVIQQTQQSNWRKELACLCGCEDDNTVLRKWTFLKLMETASDLCLVDQFGRMLTSLYKLTSTTYEFAD